MRDAPRVEVGQDNVRGAGSRNIKSCDGRRYTKVNAMKLISGRLFAFALTSLFLLGGIGERWSVSAQTSQDTAQIEEKEVDDQPGLVPSADQEQLDPQYQRQLVFYRTNEPAGTIIVQTAERYLYLVQGNNRAIRYGIGVGRDGFQWRGLVKISRKLEWPDWRPPPEMIERQPYLPRFMAGGPGNPLGARAMYLGATVYRIHGTNQPDTIGSAVSSGCFRLINPDVIDLYDRTPVGTRVIVRQAPSVES
jgi:lipoprotein-anchoring transpeptidase ErfK/SrfK